MVIKDLRAKAKLTQQAFSNYLKIPKRTIEDWENNKRTPPDYVIKLIEYKLKKEGIIS